MQNKIKAHIGNSEQLEILYRSDKKRFEEAFYAIYPDIAEKEVASFWKNRLDFEQQKMDVTKIRRTDILFLIGTCIIAGFLIKLPQWFDLRIPEEQYCMRNAALIVFLGLSLYAFLTGKITRVRSVWIPLSLFILSAVYMNLLPANKESDSIALASLHLPLMLWCLYGLIFIDFDTSDKYKRIEYIKHNGDLAVFIAVIVIAGGMLTAVTLGLFSAIELKIDPFYMDYIVQWGLVSVPVVATFIIRTFPSAANKIAPIIAHMFSPLVLITLILYLISIGITGKDPYNDREFLIVFNLMLLGVMAIIVFSISEVSRNRKQQFTGWILFSLTLVTLLVDLIALSAILYRLGEFGFTPNRTAILVSNLLIFVNLVLILRDLYRVNFKNKDIQLVEQTIANYLPFYAVWVFIVVFGFPVFFGFA
jgi:hypothetical protein